MGGYTWSNSFATPRLGADFTYASGDHDPNDNKRQTFDLLFGALHKFYGMMDVTGLRNTISPSVNATVQPTKRLSIRADFFAYWLADGNDLSYSEAGKGRTLNGYGIKPDNNNFFGTEVDCVINYVATASISLQAGYSHFFPGDYVKQSVDSVPANGGRKDANYFYLMSTFRF